MRTRTEIGVSIAAIFILIITQLAAQGVAGLLSLVNVPYGICNVVAGALYVGLAYFSLQMFLRKGMKLPGSDFGMPGFSIQGKWALTAIALPFAVKGAYLLLFSGSFVPSGMTGAQICSTLSAGIAFTGIGAGFVEEMVFRGVILNVMKKRWNPKAAVIVPSILFGAVHILGMDFSMGSCLLVLTAGTMVGIMFSLIAMESGSVWNSGIVHAVWNMVIIGGGLAVGDHADAYSVMTYVLDSRSFAVTGGEFGIESSVVSLAGYMIVSFIALFMIRAERRKQCQ